MSEIFNLEEMRLLEHKQFLKKNSYSFMQKAGKRVFEFINKNFKNKKSIIVLCGPGNNGGDGLVISQALKKLNQNVILYCLQQKFYKNDAKIAYTKNKLIKNNFKLLNVPKKSIIIDCLFGIGLNRKVKGIYKNVVKKVNNSKIHVISIDIPSGINGNNGEIMGVAIKANSTYALHAKKIGHTVNPGMKYSGKISIIDIGIK